MVLPGFSLVKTMVLGFSLAALAAGLWVVYGGGGDTRYRSRAVVGLLLALAGVIGVWGIAFFSFELVRLVLTQKFQAEGLSGVQLAGKLTYWTGITSMIQNIGAFFGVYSFGLLAQRVGRKPAFAVSFVLAMTSVASTFWFLRDFGDLWLVPLMGFGTLSVFGGYAIYFPELFPTRLRSTGTSFCYNVGRYVAASGPLTLAYLAKKLADKAAVEATAAGGNVALAKIDAFRDAASWMCLIFLLGLIVLPFLPETKGQPLPED
jgi:MFS family permease